MNRVILAIEIADAIHFEWTGGVHGALLRAVLPDDFDEADETVRAVLPAFLSVGSWGEITSLTARHRGTLLLRHRRSRHHLSQSAQRRRRSLCWLCHRGWYRQRAAAGRGGVHRALSRAGWARCATAHWRTATRQPMPIGGRRGQRAWQQSRRIAAQSPERRHAQSKPRPRFPQRKRGFTLVSGAPRV